VASLNSRGLGGLVLASSRASDIATVMTLAVQWRCLAPNWSEQREPGSPKQNCHVGRPHHPPLGDCCLGVEACGEGYVATGTRSSGTWRQ
jgi:hypothetical protein